MNNVARVHRRAGMALTCVRVVTALWRSSAAQPGYASGEQLMSLFYEGWGQELRSDPE